MRFTNFGEKQSFEKESFERKLKTPNLEKESFVGKFQMESVSPNLAKRKALRKKVWNLEKKGESLDFNVAPRQVKIYFFVWQNGCISLIHPFWRMYKNV